MDDDLHRADGETPWTRVQVARYAGVSVKTVDRRRQQGLLRYEKDGKGLVRIRKAWVDAWLSGEWPTVVMIVMIMALVALSFACFCGQNVACHLLKHFGDISPSTRL